MRRSVLILGLLSAGLLAGWCGHALTPSLARPRSVEPRGALPEWEQVSIQRFKEAAPSVVYITTTEERARDFFGLDVVEVPAGSGTGFIWDAQGHVVTNFHVIQGAARAFITLADGSRHEATYVGGAPDKDLAVLQLTKTPPKLRPIRRSMCKFCTYCRRIQFALPERVPDVLGDDRALPPEQLGHLRLGQPDRLPIEAHIDPDLAVWGLVDDHLTARRCTHHPALRISAPAMDPSLRRYSTVTPLTGIRCNARLRSTGP